MRPRKSPPLRGNKRPDDADAFFPEPENGPARAPDDLAEELAEEFVSSATSGEEAANEGHEQLVPEENGGPFVLSSGFTEFADGTDESNPEDAEPEPFPTAGTAGTPVARR
jgi:hypothetical protein